MAGSTFQTNPYDLFKLLEDCHEGVIQLPDFQRSWVWDEDRIKSLIASVSRAFPVGALMSLNTGGPVNFKPRPIEGAPAAARDKQPQSLLLDGQQRMTSLYQVTLRGKVVETVTPKKKRVKRWFYIDIRKACDPTVDREDAIIGVPEDKIIRTEFGRDVVLDLSTAEHEYEALMFPVTQVFDWDKWQDGFDRFWKGDQHESVRDEFRQFKRQILENFKYYRVPVISLDSSTSKEAVCVVFEKVNTGGKPLDAFELVTAMYAASGHELRKDWFGEDGKKGRHRRLSETLRPADEESGIIAGVTNTDFLHAVSLFFTRERRRAAEAAGKQGKELPAVSGNRQSLLNLPLDEYKRYEHQVKRDSSLRQNFCTCSTFIASLICPTNLRSFHWQPSWLTSAKIGNTKPFEQSSFVGIGTEFSGSCTVPQSIRESLETLWKSRFGSKVVQSHQLLAKRCFARTVSRPCGCGYLRPTKASTPCS